MGVMQFTVSDWQFLPPQAVAQAYMTGFDGMTLRGRIVRSDKGLILDRQTDASGIFHVPWKVDSHGEWMLSTGSLMVRERPYHLAVELARGTLNRLRNQIAAWKTLGMDLPEAVSAQMAEAMRLFARSATAWQNTIEAGKLAQATIRIGLDVIGQLTSSFAEQMMAGRHKQTEKLTTLLGVNLGDHPVEPKIASILGEAFNTAVVPMTWSMVEGKDGQIDWSCVDQQVKIAQESGMRVCGGPIIQTDMAGLPHWIYLWEDDFENLSRFVICYVEQAVSRYRGRVHLWQCTARTNICDVLPLSEEQKLKLTVAAIETARRIDSRTPLVISVSQPWGEHASSHEGELPPLHFADALVRADLGLSGICLEIDLGYHPRGTIPRDLLAIGYQIDRWSVFGLPLLVSLTIPSDEKEDPLARLKSAVPTGGPPGVATPERQCEWAQRVVSVLLSKQAVQAVFWNQLSDAVPHDYAHGGLFDLAGEPKPIIDSLGRLRQTHLV